MWQSSMESLKKGSSTHWRHALFTCCKDRAAFDVPNSPVHSLSLLFIYLLLDFFFLIYFHHLNFSCHNRSHWWKVTKTLKGIWIFITGTTSEPHRPLAVKGNGEKITAIFTLMITFKLISISWRDVGQLTSPSFISRLKKLFNPSFSDLLSKIIQDNTTFRWERM